MKKIIGAIAIVLCMAISCKNNYTKGSDYVKWGDKYFEQVMGDVFETSGNKVTYEEAASVKGIMRIHMEEEGEYKEKIRVDLWNTSVYKIIDEPENPIENIKDLYYLKNLNYLEIADGHFSGTEVFKELTQLKTLIFMGNHIDEELIEHISQNSSIMTLSIPIAEVDYSSLSQMTGLKEVILTITNYGCDINYDSLLSLPKENCLLDLSCINHEELSSVLYTMLKTHTNISKIGMIHVGNDQDISFLGNMKYMDSLSIAGSPDFAGISEMTWLKELTVWGHIELSNLTNLTNLESLELNEGNLQNGEFPNALSLDALGKHKRLKRLELYGYVMEDLDGIEAYPGLQVFICRSCLLENITPIRSLCQLEYLDLSNNLITDIDALANLKSIKRISLDENEIRDISPLKNCINLEFLCLDGNFISDISPLSDLPNLVELQIQMNDSDTKNRVDLNRWRKTLLSLPKLKYYAGGVRDDEWIDNNLPNLIRGRSDMVQ